MKENRIPNELLKESSPYLLQHAFNPVKWHPWSEEALDKAKKENKLIIVSIGYAACHWCHVMEEESFEDEKVAQVMNDHFICIKVDREERPDIDTIYMSACQLSGNSSCGWPLNAFALHDGRPFWAGSYFKKEQWINILQQFSNYHEKESAILEEAAKNIQKGMQQINHLPPFEKDNEESQLDLDEITLTLLNQMDSLKGGTIGHPKFPLPVIHDYLLDYHYYCEDQQPLNMVELSLQKMAFGGIFDQIGGGFSRYSVDDQWFAPHFEKMLYDNAQLISLYSKAYLITKNELYKEVVEKSMDFIKTEMKNEEGAFYSSLDADSEGQEGKFYTWTYDELFNIFTYETQAEIFCDYYNVEVFGNWENERNILFRKENEKAIAQKYNLSFDELNTLMNQLNQKLLLERSKRVKPGLDNKLLSSWNGLMAKACIHAYRATGKKEYLHWAYDNIQFIEKYGINEDYSLFRSLSKEKSKINAFLDDYAHLIDALTLLYQTDFNSKWLTLAKNLTQYVIKNFYDPEKHLFYYSSVLDNKLTSRPIESSDNVIPGSFSSITSALHILSHLLNENTLKQIIENVMLTMRITLSNLRQPAYYSKWLSLLLSQRKELTEVVILGPQCDEFRDKMLANYRPNTIFSGSRKGEELPLHKKRYVEGKTMIYICRGNVCSLPVDNIDQAIRMMNI